MTSKRVIPQNPMRRAIYFSHPDKIEPGLWPFRFFQPHELQSKGDGGLLADYAAIEKLDRFRDFLGTPIMVTSGYRDQIHNVKVMSQPTSLHRQGRAFDIWTPKLTPYQLAKEARIFGWEGIGLYQSFVHVDDGSPRTWGLSF